MSHGPFPWLLLRGVSMSAQDRKIPATPPPGATCVASALLPARRAALFRVAAARFTVPVRVSRYRARAALALAAGAIVPAPHASAEACSPADLVALRKPAIRTVIVAMRYNSVPTVKLQTNSAASKSYKPNK